MFAYVLRSIKDGSHYYGSTANLVSRLKDHNGGKVKYTKGHRPYELNYYEEFATRQQAITKERFFKSIDGYNWLKSKGII
ncbi:MAG: GIY-YIG nuclease family protein [Melioribacteraceae bacterium]|nr:GIY-YIG nuclease family protein [Melioribacteraceae bacterium]